MIVTMKSNRSNYSAIGEYDFKTKKLILKKDSKVSDHVGSYRGADNIRKKRNNFCKNGIVKEDIEFSSASTAACFITGTSTNGLISWKNEEGKTLKELLG